MPTTDTLGQTAEQDQVEWQLERFDPGKHDRTGFTSRVDRIDNFLQRTAKKQQKGDFTAITVAVRPDSNKVLGFYAMNSAAVAGDSLPDRLTKNSPAGRLIPAAYFSMMGIDKSVQGQKLGTMLMSAALEDFVKAGNALGISVILLDVLDDDGPVNTQRRLKFHRRFGFQSFPDDELKMFLPVKQARAWIAELAQ